MRREFEMERPSGFTLLEVMVIIVTVMLVLVVLTAPRPGRTRSKRIECVNNLKQVGLAARLWSHDNGGKFPWAVSTNQGGTIEYASSAEVVRHFSIMSNELATPRVLTCPADPGRCPARSFKVPLANRNLSYFVGLEVDQTRPQSILTGDRNLVGGVTNGAILRFVAGDSPRWGAKLHINQGNIGLADGSVQQLRDSGLARQFQQAFATQTGTTTMRLAIPRIPDELATDAPRWMLRVPVPLAGAVLTGAVLLTAWWLIRRRVLAKAADRADGS